MMADLATGKINHARMPFRKEFLKTCRSTPAVDIYESEQEVIILLDLPGIQLKDLEIELHGNILSVFGKASPDNGEAESREGKSLFIEYEPRNYFRAFLVTENFDTKRVSASLLDGVLKIALPKQNNGSRRVYVASA